MDCFAVKSFISITRKMAIQRHVFPGQWKGDKGANTAVQRQKDATPIAGFEQKMKTFSH